MKLQQSIFDEIDNNVFLGKHDEEEHAEFSDLQGEFLVNNEIIIEILEDTEKNFESFKEVIDYLYSQKFPEQFGSGDYEIINYEKKGLNKLELLRKAYSDELANNIESMLLTEFHESDLKVLNYFDIKIWGQFGSIFHPTLKWDWEENDNLEITATATYRYGAGDFIEDYFLSYDLINNTVIDSDFEFVTF